MKQLYKNYTVTQDGRIFAKKRQGSSGGELKQTTDKYGYKRVKLQINGKQETFLVHRLVALTFIENEDDKRTVNHKDGNKSNNVVDNLEWSTHSEQMFHSSRVLNRDYASRKVNITDKLRKQSAINCSKNGMKNRIVSDEDMQQIHTLRSQGLSHQKISDRLNNKVSRRTIGRVINGDHKYSQGVSHV